MQLLLVLLLFSPQSAAEEASASLTAKSLKRSELPDDFPLRILDVGFAVIEVTLENRGAKGLEIDPAEFQAFAPKGRRLESAALTDVVPELVKFHSRTGSPGVHGELYRRRLPYPYGGPHRSPQTGPSVAGPRMVSAGLAAEIRQSLEKHLLQETRLAAGGQVKGFLFFKSRQSGNRLEGGRVVFQELEASLD